MSSINLLLQTYKPGIPKRYLLFVAAAVWTFAGGMLLFRGFTMLLLYPQMLWLKIGGSLIGGIIFFVLMFSKISYKHTHRIINLQHEHPCFFSFFNWRSYFLMLIMMSSGIFLRKTGIVPLEYLSVFYVTMGIPLFLSAFRFYYNGFNYQNVSTKLTSDN
ncbi:MAG: hypothetical protein P4L34_13765 [Paludibacter sp.]|nr:hypothetical protein [Paludibacter sp.]